MALRNEQLEQFSPQMPFVGAIQSITDLGLLIGKAWKKAAEKPKQAEELKTIDSPVDSDPVHVLN